MPDRNTSGADEIFKQRLMRGLERDLARSDASRLAVEIREKAGLSPSQLAKLTGIRTSVIKRFEEGDYGGDCRGILYIIANACGVGIQLTSYQLVVQDMKD